MINTNFDKYSVALPTDFSFHRKTDNNYLQTNVLEAFYPFCIYSFLIERM